MFFWYYDYNIILSKWSVCIILLAVTVVHRFRIGWWRLWNNTVLNLMFIVLCSVAECKNVWQNYWQYLARGQMSVYILQTHVYHTKKLKLLPSKPFFFIIAPRRTIFQGFSMSSIWMKTLSRLRKEDREVVRGGREKRRGVWGLMLVCQVWEINIPNAMLGGLIHNHFPEATASGTAFDNGENGKLVSIEWIIPFNGTENGFL